MTMAVAGRMTFGKLTPPELRGSVDVPDATKPPQEASSDEEGGSAMRRAGRLSDHT